MYPIVSFFTVWFLWETTFSRNITVKQLPAAKSSTVSEKCVQELFLKKTVKAFVFLGAITRDMFPLATQFHRT